MNKTCFKCQIEQPIENFYKHKAMSDGHLNKCKDCARKDVIEHRKNNDSVREYDRKRAKTPDRKFKQIQITKEWRLNNPDGYAAHIIVSNAVKSGKLIKASCKVCGDLKVHAHHKDYSKPLEVEWFCARHHSKTHNPENF